MKTDAALWSSFRKPAIVAALLAALFCFFLLVTSSSPRGRLNVMQFAAVAFVLLIVARSWPGSTKDAPAGVLGSRGYGGMWLAIAAGAIVWAFSFPVGFINDDFGLIYGARQAGWSHFWEFLQTQSGVFFRPLGYSSIFLDYHIWGQWAPGYHLTNIVLQLAAIAGLYCLCNELGADGETSTSAALIYAVLPAHAEAITWIGCRFGLLSDALIIGAAVLYLGSRRMDRKAGSEVAYGAAMACFVLATLSKESAFVFPVLLILFEVFVTSKRRFRPVVGFFVVAASIFVCRWVLMGGIGGYAASVAGSSATLDIGFKTFEGLLLRAPAVMLFGYNWFQPPLVVMTVLASVAGAVLLVLAGLSRKVRLERGIVALSLAWMVVAIAPAHPLLMIGADLTNSRNLHPGTVGLALLLAHLLAKTVPADLRRWPVVLLVTVLSISSLLNMSAWRWTSQLTERFLADVRTLEPAPVGYTEFIVYGMPETVRGVFLLHEGLIESLRLGYGRDDMGARRAAPNDAGEVLRGSVVRLEWQGETAEPLVRRLP